MIVMVKIVLNALMVITIMLLKHYDDHVLDGRWGTCSGSGCFIREIHAKGISYRQRAEFLTQLSSPKVLQWFPYGMYWYALRSHQ